MESINISEETRDRILRFIRRSRPSFAYGSKPVLKNEEEVISFLLDFAEKYSFEILEYMLSQPFISGEMPKAIFDDPKKRGKVLEKKFSEEEENG